MNLKSYNKFIVMMEHCNYMHGPTGKPMIHGGDFMKFMDQSAAITVSELLEDSECDSAVTHKMPELTFHKAAECGDIIYLESEVVGLRLKAIIVEVKCFRKKHATKERDFIAEARFVFISRKDGMIHNHGLVMPEEKATPHQIHECYSQNPIGDARPNLTVAPRMISEFCPPDAISHKKLDYHIGAASSKISPMTKPDEGHHQIVS